MDSTDDWRSLLNYKYAEPEYQALFSNNTRPNQPPPPPPFSSSGSIKKTSIDGGSIRSESHVEDEIIDGRKLYENFTATRFPPQPEIPDPLNEYKYNFNLEDILSRINVTPEDNEVIASIQFLQAVLGTLVTKASELRNSIIEHAAYIRQLKQPLQPDDIEYLDSTVFLNYASMREELQEISDELSLLKPWKVRHLFIDELDEEALIEAAGGLVNHSGIIHLLAESYGCGHKFMELERAIVSVGLELQDEITRSLITVSQLFDYTAAMIKYPNGIKEIVTWEEFDDMYEKIAARRSALSRDFERFMRNKRLPVTNTLFAYLQHPDQYGYFLAFKQYKFAPGEFAGMMEWLEQQDEQAVRAFQPSSPASHDSSTSNNIPFSESKLDSKQSKNVVVDPPNSILRNIRVLSLQHCQLTDRDAHRLTQALPRLTRLTALNLSHNLLSYSALASLATVVLQHPTCVISLQMLYLDHNRIASDGLQVLAQILYPHFARLVKLSLNDNPVGDEGVYLLLQSLLNPQRRAYAHFPSLPIQNTKDKKHKRTKNKTSLSDDQDDDDDDEEVEEVVMTLDVPTRRGLQFQQTQSKSSHNTTAAVMREALDSRGRVRGSILFGEQYSHNLTTPAVAGGGGNGSETGSNAGGNEEVQLALQSQRRYPLSCYLCDYFAPSLVLETLRSLLAAAEYDVQHGGDGKATLRQHHYLFQRHQQSVNNTDNGNSNSKEEEDNQVCQINYNWVNDEREEFTMDLLPSDYSSEDSETEDRRRIANAVARVQKLRGVITAAATAAAGEHSDAGSVAEARFRRIPRRTLQRITQRIQRARERQRRREKLTFRERLVLREKRALGVHETRKKLGVVIEDEAQAEEDLLEESSDDGDDDYHESDEEEGQDESGYDGGFVKNASEEVKRKEGDKGEKDDDDEDEDEDDVDDDDKTLVLEYSDSHVAQRRASVGSVAQRSVGSESTKKRRKKANKTQKTQITQQPSTQTAEEDAAAVAMAQLRLARAKRNVLTASALLTRAKQTRVYAKYPLLVQRFLKIRLKMIAVTMFLSLGKRTLLPYLGSLSLARCDLSHRILPALAMVLREDDCLLSLNVSGNRQLLARQEDCALFASALRYSLDMKTGQYRKPSPQQLRKMQLLQQQQHQQALSQSTSSQPVDVPPALPLPAADTTFYPTSLQHLALNHVDMNDAGIVTLYTALSMPGSPLVRIELSGNRFGPTGVNVLANLCQRGNFFLGSGALVSSGSQPIKTEKRETQTLKASSTLTSTAGKGHVYDPLVSPAKKLKPPVFSAEDDDYHRDEGYLADDMLLELEEDAPQQDKGKTNNADKSSKREQEEKDEKERKEKRRLMRLRRESLALGQSNAADWKDPVRLVEEDEDTLGSFQDGDTWTDEGESDLEEGDDYEDDIYDDDD